ncbi:MAG: hypothetical protein PWR06_950 [Thermoanaerobacteraceae bacterium]|nr:hypothetical protein [Thermoanaerobacteraceae bacterium]
MPFAMVLEEFNKPLVLREFPEPDLKPGEVLVKIEAAGVCGSDVHMWRGNDPRTPLPIILGHEGVGRVKKINGKKRTVLGEKIKEGDMILWNRGVSCSHCYFCSVKKEPSLCTNRWVYGINVSCGEPPHLKGCYAEEVLLSSDTDIFKVPESVDPAVLVPVSCSGATIAHAFDLAKPEEGDKILIQGPGPLGIFATAFAKAYGASEIIIIGGTEERLEMAKRFGATFTINRKKLSPEQRKEMVMERTHGLGADIAVEATGQPDAVSEGIDLVRRGGKYLMAGFGDPNGTVTLDCYKDIAHKNINIQGVWVSDTKHTHMALKLLLNNLKLFSELVSHRLPLDKANEALELMESKKATKVVLTP